MARPIGNVTKRRETHNFLWPRWISEAHHYHKQKTRGADEKILLTLTPPHDIGASAVKSLPLVIYVLGTRLSTLCSTKQRRGILHLIDVWRNVALPKPLLQSGSNMRHEQRSQVQRVVSYGADRMSYVSGATPRISSKRAMRGLGVIRRT